MRRFVITSAATVSGVVLLLSMKPHSATTASSRPISTGSGGAASAGSGSGGTSGGSASSSASAGAASGSASGTRTVTGAEAETRYGPIQVQITVKAKKITNVSVLEYPSESPRDQMINSYALPQLNQEAISAQSAQIDVVSGATYTSDGYAQSLQSAIDKAGL